MATRRCFPVDPTTLFPFFRPPPPPGSRPATPPPLSVGSSEVRHSPSCSGSPSHLSAPPRRPESSSLGPAAARRTAGSATSRPSLRPSRRHTPFSFSTRPQSRNKLREESTNMRGIGGPLLTVSDLLSDLAVKGGDDHLEAGGDASVPSSPLAVQQAEEADPSKLQGLFVEEYDNLVKSLRENDPSWPSLMLKLCRALKTSDKLLSCANVNAEQLLEVLERLEHVLERGDHAVGAIIEGLQTMRLNEDHQTSKSKPPSK